MKLLLSYIIGLFLILSLSACHDGGNATTLLPVSYTHLKLPTNSLV